MCVAVGRRFELVRHPATLVTIPRTTGGSPRFPQMLSGALIEHSSYYPNGARETYLTTSDGEVQPEPQGFTTKESDHELGVAYFGERYLVPRIGRWASPDPLATHAFTGDEALNSYHYIRGALLQGRDLLGLRLFIDPSMGEAKAMAVLKNLHNLTSDEIQYNRKTGEVTVRNRDTTPSKPSGTELVRRLVEDEDRDVTIRTTDGKSKTTASRTPRHDGSVPPSDSTVRWNPDSRARVLVRPPGSSGTEWREQDPAMELGGELAHADRIRRGEARAESQVGHRPFRNPRGEPRLETYPVEEYETHGIPYITDSGPEGEPDQRFTQDDLRRGTVVQPGTALSERMERDITENALRRENGLPARQRYGGPSSSGGTQASVPPDGKPSESDD